MDTVHGLHGDVGIMVQLLDGIQLGQRPVMEDGVADVQIYQWIFTEQFPDAGSRAEGEGDGHNRTIKFHGIFENCLFEWVNIGIEEPYGAFREEMYPFFFSPTLLP